MDCREPNMKGFTSILAGLVLSGALGAGAADSKDDSTKLIKLLQTSTVSLLKEGNARFAAGKPQSPNAEPARRMELAANGQEPLATILACSDSRDPVELMFDRGVGDLFVVRVAGNVAGVSETATIEYGVTHLGTPVLLVMGHTKCGAVTAVVKGAELHGHLVALAKLIEPAAKKAKAAGVSGEDAVPVAIQLNVWLQIESLLTRSSLIRNHAAAGKVEVMGAVYDIASGKVVWLGKHPDMDRLLALPVSPDEEVHTPGLSDAHSPAGGHEPAAAKPAAGGLAHSVPVPSPGAATVKHADPAPPKAAGPFASAKPTPSGPGAAAPTSGTTKAPGKNPLGPPPPAEPHDAHAAAVPAKAH